MWSSCILISLFYPGCAHWDSDTVVLTSRIGHLSDTFEELELEGMRRLALLLAFNAGYQKGAAGRVMARFEYISF